MAGLEKKDVDIIRKELDEAKNPLYFFHDDADGLCSFLLLYRYVKEGHGIIVKTNPSVDEKFLRKVEEYDPDKIFITDLAIVEQEFIDQAKRNIIWIDHHTPLKRENILYFNPRIKDKDKNIPASKLCYDVVKKDLWIATCGAVADWHWPDFIEDFKKMYPKLLPKDIDDPETALFETELGRLISIISFCLKGHTKQIMRAIKVFTRIKDPYEILEQKTPQGKFIYRFSQKYIEDYHRLLNQAIKAETKDNIKKFIYTSKDISFTKDISNEMLHRFSKNIIIIGREKSEEIKMSIRSKTAQIPKILEKALEGVEGYGGGHEYACGANVAKKDFDKFLEQFKTELHKNM